MAVGRLERLAVLDNDQLVYTRLAESDPDADGGEAADEEPAGAMMR